MPGAHLSRVAERASDACIPLQVLWELTRRCHLSCRHCYVPPPDAAATELDRGEIRRVLAELRAAGAFFLTLTGGEIFLRPDVLEIARAARRLGFAVRLFTTGTLLRRQQVDEIARLRPTAVELSVYGATAEAHDGVTGSPGSFRRTLRAAVRLRRAGVPVVLKSPLLRSLGDAAFDLPALARRLGVGVRLDPAVARPERGPHAAATPRRSEGPVERPPVVSVARLFLAHGVGAPLVPPPEPGATPCAIARRVVRIGPTGLVYPCALYCEPAGDLRAAPFDAIWRESPLLLRLRSTTVDDLRGACAGCDRAGYCGRCTALALAEHGDALGPSSEACDRAAAREAARAGGSTTT
ncbi:MAG: radical SAM protein [Deltaproteobacteria bacterium]|nr:radical SAM protein [Deltaproteobacteria bacterium]